MESGRHAEQVTLLPRQRGNSRAKDDLLRASAGHAPYNRQPRSIHLYNWPWLPFKGHPGLDSLQKEARARCRCILLSCLLAKDSKPANWSHNGFGTSPRLPETGGGQAASEPGSQGSQGNQGKPGRQEARGSEGSQEARKAMGPLGPLGSFWLFLARPGFS